MLDDWTFISSYPLTVYDVKKYLSSHFQEVPFIRKMTCTEGKCYNASNMPSKPWPKCYTSFTWTPWHEVCCASFLALSYCGDECRGSY